MPREPLPLAPEDFYMEGEILVFTAAYHLKRGYCCGSGCRHCPYPKDDSDASSREDNHPDTPSS